MEMENFNKQIFVFQLPPRDGELSPPPIPPRLHFSVAPCHRSHTNEFNGRSNLLLPNTSSIMIRRNLASEKRSSTGACSGAQSMSMNTTSMTLHSAVETTSLSYSLTRNQTQCPTYPQFSQPTIAASHLNAGTSISVSTWDDQSISPALSSSTTTSPMTPMTPISPHIPAVGVQVSDTHSTVAPPYHRYKTTAITQHATGVSSSINPYATSVAHHQQQQQLQQQQQQHEQRFPQPIVSSTLPGKSSPKDFFSITEGTPKLPPKPSLSGNFYNSSGKHNPNVYTNTVQSVQMWKSNP